MSLPTRIITALGAALLLAGPAGLQAETTASGLADIAAGSHRSAENRARNTARHPVATLEFFGIAPDMTVVEIWPAGGWYTEILAPYLNDNGQYIAAHWDPDAESEFVRRGVERYRAKLAEHPELYGNARMGVLMHPDKMDFAPAESVDLVLTFRNIHNWMGRDYADAMFAAMYRALKPGGTLGVVEHRGDPALPQDPTAAKGYVTEEHAIALAEQAGFRLVARSAIHAQPEHTKDKELGVWTLPPTLAAGDEPRYQDIGESDRFTLKFVK